MGLQGDKLVADFEEGTGPNHKVIGTNPILSNTWTHVAATYNQTTGVWNLYINGNLDKTLTLSAAFTPANTSTQHAAIGSAITSSAATPPAAAAGFFQGRIDEARIWNVARTQAEIQANMNLELTSGTGLIGRWGLNEGTGVNAANSIGGSPAGTLTNTPTWVAGAPAFNPPPNAPTALTATAVSPFQISLAWTDNATNETGFEVERSTTGIGGTYTLFATVGANSVSFNNVNISANTEYCYRVRAINTGGNSAYATAICATTPTEGTANALDLGASGAYVSMGAAPSLATQNFTVETWFKKTGTGITNTTGTGGITIIPIIAKGSPEAEASVVDANYILGIQATTNFLAADFEEGTGSASPGLNHPLVGTTAITDNVWHHAAVTFQGGVYSLYLDGILQNSLNLGASVWPQGASTQHFAMGTMLNSTGAAVGKFQGVLDEVRVWNYGRTFSEIQTSANLQLTTTQSGLLGRWGLNDMVGTNVNASAGTSVNGTIIGAGSSWVTPGGSFNLVFTPNSPTSLTATTSSSTEIQLNWTDNATNETGFEIHRSTTGIAGTYTLLTTVAANTITFADASLTANTEYCYQVRAINTFGNSNFSNQICATTSAPAENALSLGSSGGYVTFGPGTALSTNTGGNTNNFTIETWFNKTGTGVGYVTGSYTNTSYTGTFIPLISKGAQETDNVRENDENYILGIDFGTNKIAADFEEGTGSTSPGQNHPIVGSTIITDNVWHHAAATFNNGVFKVYLDGLLENTTDFGTAIWPQGLSTVATSLGTMINSTGATFGSFDGVLDEVRIWNVAKSDAEILANANLQITAAQAGLIGRFALNEGVGAVVNGSAGTTSIGNIVGTPIPTLSTGWSWVNPGAPFNINTSIPLAPTNLTLSAQTASSIQLNWLDNSSNETGFEIVRSTTGVAGTYLPLVTVASNTASYVDNTFVTSSQYCYKVRAINGTESSTYTNSACGVGALGEALNFGSNQAYVTFGTAAGLATPTYTAEAWFKKTGTGTPNTTGTGGIDIIPIISKGSPEAENSNVDANYILGIQSGTNFLAADFEEGTGSASPGANHPIVGTTVIADNVWHHAAVTFENGQYKLYLDGLLENSADLTPAVFPQGASIQPAALGTMIRSNNTANGFFQGVIDEARIWSYARTITEIQSTANSQLSASMSGLIARWSLNEEPGSVVSGSAGTSFNGTITGTGWSWVTGAPFNLVFNLPTLPNAPTNLLLTEISSNNVKIDWVDNANNETGFDIERSTTGTSGPFTLIASVGADFITYNDLTTAGGSNYCYRVRAINGLGASAFVGPNCIITSNSISFQDGVNSYAGTRDTYLYNTSPTIVRGAEVTFIQDKDTAPIERTSLLKFDLTSIPAGSTIQSATLQFYVQAEGQGFNMHKMLVPWDEATISYASNGNRHFAPNNLDAESALNINWPGIDGLQDFITLTVPTATIESWVNNASTNNGWLMIATHADDGQQLSSRENTVVANRPKLTLNYTLPAPLPPNQPTNPNPAIAATSVGTSPNICADVSDPNGGNLEVKYYGRKKQAPIGSNFTIIGLPDTQFYTEEVPGTNSGGGGHNGIFTAQTEWIKANRVAKNIVFVTQLGDCVQNGDNPPGSNDEIEWQRANTAFSILENPSVPITDGIPYAVSVGNHDQGTIGNPDGNNVYYNQYFGVPRFTGRGYYGGHYGSNNDNHYQLFSGGGIDFIHISLEYYGNGTTASLQPVLDWADALLKAYPNRKGIISSHNLLGTGNPASFQGPGQKVYDDLKDNPNLILMLAGHVPGEGRRSDTYLGNTVHTLMSDYQSGFTNGGNGWLRIMEFLPNTNQVSVKTFSPYQNAPTGAFRTQSTSEFTIPVNLATAPLPFNLIGTNASANSGSNSCINWPSLDNDTEYEWYVTVSDGTNTVTGPTWSFTTGAPLPTAIAPSNQTYCSGEVTAAIALSGTPSGVVFDISGGASIGLANQTGVTSIPSFTAVAGSATVSITPRIGSTSGVAVSYGVTVTPSTTHTTTVSVCDTYTWTAGNGQTYTSSGNYTYVNGCHTETLALTITPSTTHTTTVSVCDTYTWTAGNGQTYTSSGNYTYVNGCHTETLALTITPSTTHTTTVSVCDTYTWTAGNGQTYTLSGNYTYVNGCHTETLALTITPSTTHTTTVSVCDTYTWTAGNGQTYTSSGNYTYVNGCHTETLALTITPSTTHTTTVSVCDTYTWTAGNGQTYTTSGNYTYVNGCHTETLALTITPSTTHTTTVSVCDTYTWTAGNGQTYTSSGNYTYVNGCHTETLALTITPSTTHTTTVSVCDTYTWTAGNGQTYTTSGNYTYVNGCHTETLALTITPSTTHTTTVSVCDTYTWTAGNGQTYTTSGNYTYVNGCHTETLALTITPSTTHTTTVSVCDTYTWTAGNGQTYTTSGNYTYVNGCHTETLALTITPSTTHTTTVSVCDTYTWTAGNGQTYTTSGNYTYVNGCHTETLALTITPSTTHTTTVSVCDTYTWTAGNGQTYTTSGNYTYVNGCHTETLALTITPSTTHTTTVSVCDTYTWTAGNGQTYTSSGNYTYVNGCHTETLALTITPSTTHTITVSVCDTYTWTAGNGQTYTTSGNYTYVNGCHTETLALTITPSTTHTTTVSVCDTYTWTAGNGQTYTTSGNYTYVNGCHTETLALTITPSTTHTTTVSVCDTYTWTAGNGQTYTTSGNYTYVNGCHTETLALTITPSTTHTTTVSVCDTYTWTAGNGQTYTTSGNYTYVNGCHTETLALTITPSTTHTTTVSVCDTYTWTSGNGQTYTTSGNYTYVNGCHTETLALTITPSTTHTTTVSVCDTYTWTAGNGQTYTTSGNYTYVNGCHTETLALTITPSTTHTTTVSVCDTYTWTAGNGQTYTTSGNYTYVNGCHTETLALTITPSTTHTTTVSVCDTYTWTAGNGQTYTTSGNYTYVNGCHTETLALTITPSTTHTTTVSVCDTYTWTAGNGQTYTTSGNYTYVNGCHTETLALTITPSTTHTTTVSVCDTYTWTAGNGQTYTTSGNYTYVNGCHTETLALTITPSTTHTTTVSVCDTYTWTAGNGQTYTTSGNYTYVNGCHTETLALTITPSTTHTTTVSVCDTYTWTAGNGQTYTTSGNYTYVNGCHTETLALTITPSTTHTTTVSVCDTYTWTAGNGQTYTTSGNYTYVNGCHTETLALTITPSTTHTTTVSVCDTYTWTAGNGQTYTTSGNYTYVNGCHTETLALTITPSTTHTTTVSVCDTYTWTAGNGQT